MLQLNNMPVSIPIQNGDALDADQAFLDMKFNRFLDQMIEPFKGNFKHMIFRVIGQTEQLNPFSLNLIAYLRGDDSQFCPSVANVL